MAIAALLVSACLSWHGSPGAGFKATAGGSWPDQPPRFDQISVPIETWGPVLLAQDARLNPLEVAGWLGLAQGSYRRGQPESGFDDEEARGRRSFVDVLGENTLSRGQEPWPSVMLAQSAELRPPQGPSRTGLPPNVIVYMDPDYQETTGYDHTFPRAQVCETAEAWASAGAHVYISEAEPVSDLGWPAVEITSERVGQARTFSKQQREFVTCSRPPLWTPPIQRSMF
jgi:hypothetical protein